MINNTTDEMAGLLNMTFDNIPSDFATRILRFDSNGNYVNVQPSDYDFNNDYEQYWANLANEYNEFTSTDFTIVTVQIPILRMELLHESIMFIGLIRNTLISEGAELLDIKLFFGSNALIKFRCPFTRTVASVQDALEHALASA